MFDSSTKISTRRLGRGLGVESFVEEAGEDFITSRNYGERRPERHEPSPHVVHSLSSQVFRAWSHGGTSPAKIEFMSALPPMLNHLALLIDLREDRLEKTTVPFLRRQMSVELETLLKRFETEYQEFLLTSGQSASPELLKSAA
jgi:hypothetical protein